jgi:hypothetical protein
MFAGLAALFGALIGVVVAGEYARACECVAPSWQLKLNNTTDPDEGIWPERPSLEAYTSGPLLFWNQRAQDPKIDHLQAGTW